MKQTITSALTAVALAASFATAQVVYAQDFQKGSDAAQKGDFATALQEWRPLAEQGISSAQYNLGLMYVNGNGVTQDYKEAVKWFRLAGGQGYISAHYSLGLMHERGQGVMQDYEEAVKWYRLAAEKGDASAQYNLGLKYAKGQGVIQDHVLAYMWWNIAATTGHSNASENKDIAAGMMTASQLEKAQDLARECVKKNYKGC